MKKNQKEEISGKSSHHATSLISILSASAIGLATIGLFFVYEASSILSLYQRDNSFYYVKLQLIWFLMGIFCVFIFTILPYQWLCKSSTFILFIVGILLILVLFSPSAKGASRWINLGYFNLQPSELLKFSLILYLPYWLKMKNSSFFAFLILLISLVFLLMMQPDMGTTIVVLSVSATIYFLSDKNSFPLFAFIPFGVISFVILIITTPYRLARLTGFLNPDADPLGSTYHIKQILIALSSGGWFGKGFGASRQKYLYLPEAHTDSIFAIVGEEFGFIGASFTVVFYAIFVLLLYKAYEQIQNPLGKLVSAGIFAFFSSQIIVNLCSMVGLFPLTGVPLPFFSYGGSHTIITFSLIGILFNILIQEKKENSKDEDEDEDEESAYKSRKKIKKIKTLSRSLLKGKNYKIKR